MDRLTRHADLLALSGGDPWVRWALPDPLPGEVWLHQGVALVQRTGHRPGFWVAPLRAGMPAVDEPDRMAAALVALRDGEHLGRLGSRSVSVPQEHAAVAHRVLDLGDGGDWEWMWTTTLPDVDARERDVIPLDDGRDAVELEEFTRANNPRVWTEVGTGRVHRWVGLRDESGQLIAIGGAELEATGIPHLAGIVTAVERRGAGLARVVSAALTRWALEAHGVCTLGMFSDNDAARRLYAGLGYRTARAWHSRMLAPRG
ncbi:GNAT family N-acetyltransferase [Serinicoccus kebangsaanensis]|uniref:GNAT family N-acetyltransferase n=1 Tax=Serinicoccus kebangsaanensis TaxID=2602069 RepID=UPI00124D33EE|nr:GNAT family N-acetyltransferase [Serinicoccus kebangsaanensis]